MRHRLLIALALAGAPAAEAQTRTPPPADLVVHHAAIWTVDAANPRAQAIAISGGTIVAIGKNEAIMPRVGPNTRVIDAHGRTVLPGFTDTHVHFLSGALGLARVDLEGARDVAELRTRLARYRDAHPGTGWIQGRGWNYAMFGREALPHKKYLDDLFPDRPVLLSGYDGHTSWANSKALALAGITTSTPDPTNGTIVRDANGEPTGALKEKASSLVGRLVPAPTRAENVQALVAGMKLAGSLGVTRVHSAGGDFEVLPLLDSLQKAGALTVRFDIGYFVNPPSLASADLVAIEDARTRYTGDWLSGGLIKMMIDGVIESHTAAMLGPYTDQPTTSGTLFWEPKAFADAVRVLDGKGLRIMTHAIGELGVRTTLDAYAAARKANGVRADRRMRVEHIETIAAADIRRFGAQGVIASMQPLHAYPDVNTTAVWARNIGPERAGRAWAWRRIAAGGGKLAFGSDWPVVTLNPWPGIQVGVTRQTEAGVPKGGFVPSERLSVADMVAGYTLGSAYAGGRESKEGTLTVGKLGDLIILEDDPFTSAPARLAGMQVDATIVGGRVVYERRK